MLLVSTLHVASPPGGRAPSLRIHLASGSGHSGSCSRWSSLSICVIFSSYVLPFFFSFFFFLSLSFMYFLSPSMYPLGCWRTYTCVSDSVVSVELGCDTICPPIARERFQPALELQAGTARSTQNTCTSVYGM